MLNIYALLRNRSKGIIISNPIKDGSYTKEQLSTILFGQFPSLKSEQIERIWAFKVRPEYNNTVILQSPEISVSIIQ